MVEEKIWVGKKLIRGGRIRLNPEMQEPATPNLSQQQTRRKRDPLPKPGGAKRTGSK